MILWTLTFLLDIIKLMYEEEQEKIQQTSYSTEISSKKDLSTREKFMKCTQTLKETGQA